MKRRMLLKSCLIAAPVGLTLGLAMPLEKLNAKKKLPSSGASICPNCPHEGTLRTEVYINDKFIVGFNRGLTDQEANQIMDANAESDVKFMAFGWREY